MTVPWNKDAYQYSYELECRVGRLLDENKELKAKLKAAEAALAEERERCAKIAEKIDGENTAAFAVVRLAAPYEPKPFIGTKPLGITIADAIRARSFTSSIQEKGNG